MEGHYCVDGKGIASFPEKMPARKNAHFSGQKQRQYKQIFVLMVHSLAKFFLNYLSFSIKLSGKSKDEMRV